MNDKILQRISGQFALGLDSIHGMAHWRRVERFGLMLAEKTGADAEVIRLFAYLHDSCRRNELWDLGHGARSADFAAKCYRNGTLGISAKQFEQLSYACRHHDNPFAKPDGVTVMTCWDADRLDLWRVGEVPDPNRLYTEAARDPVMINYSRE